MRSIYCLLFVCLSFVVYGQNRVPFVGKIVSQFGLDPGITLENLANKSVKHIGITGDFAILGQVGDSLKVKNQFDDSVIYVLDERDLLRELLLINFEGTNKNKVLDEIVINKLDFVAIGLDFSHMKRYTPIEGRLYKANTPDMFSLDGLINGISGKTKMLKKALVYEQSESAMEKLYDFFSKDDLSKRFDIPLDKVGGFVYFLVKDNELSSILLNDENNRRQVEFRMSELLPKYRQQVSQ